MISTAGRRADEACSHVDMVFPVEGRQVPADYRESAWLALLRVAPWLADEPGTGIVSLRTCQPLAGVALLPRRSRLVLRVASPDTDRMAVLAGRSLDIHGDTIRIGSGCLRELDASPTLHAPLVDMSIDDEARFAAVLEQRLAALGIDRPSILGRRRHLTAAGRQVTCFPVVVHGCRPHESIRLQCLGLGEGRGYGCGIFVPHKKIEGLDE